MEAVLHYSILYKVKYITIVSYCFVDSMRTNGYDYAAREIPIMVYGGRCTVTINPPDTGTRLTFLLEIELLGLAELKVSVYRFACVTDTMPGFCKYTCKVA